MSFLRVVPWVIVLGLPIRAAPAPAETALDPSPAALLAEVAGGGPAALRARAGLRQAHAAWLLARAEAALAGGRLDLLRQVESLARLRYARSEGTQADAFRAQAELMRGLARAEALEAETARRWDDLERRAGRALGEASAGPVAFALEPVGPDDGPWLARARLASPGADVERRVRARLLQLRALERALAVYDDGLLPQGELALESAMGAYESGRLALDAVLATLLAQADDARARLRLLAEHAGRRAELEAAADAADLGACDAPAPVER